MFFLIVLGQYELLNFYSYQIKYNSYVIKNDDEFKIIINKSSISIFPQIFINNKFFGGYSELSNLSGKGDLIKLIY